jgi:uncharacterized protein Usg
MRLPAAAAHAPGECQLVEILVFSLAFTIGAHVILMTLWRINAGNGAASDRERSMSLALQLKDYRLTTAEILYHLPDHPRLLQTYVWQELDLAPEFPALHKFLDFWHRELDGKVHSVRVASAKLVKPASVRHPGAWLRPH